MIKWYLITLTALFVFLCSMLELYTFYNNVVKMLNINTFLIIFIKKL